MSRSIVDKQRIKLMYDLGASNDEVGYHTSYEWSNAIENLIEELKEKVNSLILMRDEIYGFHNIQDNIQVVINEINRQIYIEVKIEAEFWAQEPYDFKRSKNFVA